MLKKGLDPSQTRGLIFLKGVDKGGGGGVRGIILINWGWGGGRGLNLVIYSVSFPGVRIILTRSIQIQPALPLVKSLILNNVCCRRV